MEWATARSRFCFLDRALEGGGGFCPSISWTSQVATDAEGKLIGTTWTPHLLGPTELVRYPRESDAKFAQRNAVALYENHLASACSKFVGFLSRRRPQRQNIDAPLVSLFLQDCDMRGSSLDDFWAAFSIEAKARGSMLLVIDMPKGEPAANLADQITRRRIPYIRAAEPEDVESFQLNEETGLFDSVTIEDEEEIDGKCVKVHRIYDAKAWVIKRADSEVIIDQGEHPFGACPVLPFTEDGSEFPKVGTFAQIADLSKRIMNARSERDEILRSQTFSLLTLQVPPEQSGTFDAAKISATVGTHSMLVHAGLQPAFIAPDSGPAETYAKSISELEDAIRRVSMDTSTDSSGMRAQESGVSRRLRFEALNASLADFAKQVQRVEKQLWLLFANATTSGSDVQVSYPTDFNLADVMAEIDILTGMQTTGFPPAVLNEKRRAIVAVEFDAASDEVKANLDRALNELDQNAPATQPTTTP